MCRYRISCSFNRKTAFIISFIPVEEYVSLLEKFYKNKDKYIIQDP